MNAEDKKVADVPYIVYESEQSRMERMKIRLYILCVLMLIALVSSNVLWYLHTVRAGR